MSPVSQCAPLFTFRASVNDTVTTFLMDSGCSAALIRAKFLGKHFPTIPQRRFARPIAYGQAGSGRIIARSVVQMTLTIGSFKRAWEFQVVDNLCVPVFLGTAFMDRCIHGQLYGPRRIEFRDGNVFLVGEPPPIYPTIAAVGPPYNLGTYALGARATFTASRLTNGTLRLTNCRQSRSNASSPSTSSSRVFTRSKVDTHQRVNAVAQHRHKHAKSRSTCQATLAHRPNDEQRSRAFQKALHATRTITAARPPSIQPSSSSMTRPPPNCQTRRDPPPAPITSTSLPIASQAHRPPPSAPTSSATTIGRVPTTVKRHRRRGKSSASKFRPDDMSRAVALQNAISKTTHIIASQATVVSPSSQGGSTVPRASESATVRASIAPLAESPKVAQHAQPTRRQGTNQSRSARRRARQRKQTPDDAEFFLASAAVVTIPPLGEVVMPTRVVARATGTPKQRQAASSIGSLSTAVVAAVLARQAEQALVEPIEAAQRSLHVEIGDALIDKAQFASPPLRVRNATGEEICIAKGRRLATLTLEFVIEGTIYDQKDDDTCAGCCAVSPMANATPVIAPASVNEPEQNAPPCTSDVRELPPQGPPPSVTPEQVAKVVQQLDLGNFDGTEQQKRRLFELAFEFADVFRPLDEGEELPKINVVQHHIPLKPGTQPIAQKPFKCPHRLRPTLRELLAKLQRQGIIKRGFSEYSSPAFLVRKADGGYRLCAAYQRLNQATIQTHPSAPRIDINVGRLADSNYFTTIDLLSFYLQCEIAPCCVKKASIVCDYDQWLVTRASFGLVDAGRTMERALQVVFDDLPPDVRVATEQYVDDLLVHSKTFDEHIHHLREVLLRLRRANLRANIKKCKLGCASTDYLGFNIARNGVSMSNKHVEAVTRLSTPQNASEVQHAIGLFSFNRAFVPKFAKICRPLHLVARKSVPFEWTSECQTAFDTLKRLLTTAPVLAHPIFSDDPSEKPFEMYCDASGKALACHLVQRQNGKARTIGYYGRQFTAPEQNYAATQRECLAIVASLRHFRAILYKSKVIVKTDCLPLKWLMSNTTLPDSLARYALELSSYNIVIDHVSGRSNRVADALSRLRYPESICPPDGAKYARARLHKRISGHLPRAESAPPTSARCSSPTPIATTGNDEIHRDEQNAQPDKFESIATQPTNNVCSAPPPSRIARVGTALKRIVKRWPRRRANPTTELTSSAKSAAASMSIATDESEDDEQSVIYIGEYRPNRDSLDATSATSRQHVAAATDNECTCDDRPASAPPSTGHPIDYVQCPQHDLEVRRDENILATPNEQLIAAQVADAIIGPLRNHIINGTQPHSAQIDAHEWRMLVSQHARLQVREGVLRRRWRRCAGAPVKWTLVTPKSMRQEAMQMAHAHPMSAHAGQRRSIQRLVSTCYWPSVRAEMEEFCRQCVECGQSVLANPTPRAKLGHVPITRINQQFSIDVVGPLNRTASGNCYILTIQDVFSGFVTFYPLRAANALTCAKLLFKAIALRGMPESIKTDRGKEFTAALYQETCRLLGIRHLVTAAANPQANPCERVHSVLGRQLKTFADAERAWDISLDLYAFAINTAVSESSRVSPWAITHTYEARQPMQAFASVASDANYRSPHQFVDHWKEKAKRVFEFVRANKEAASEASRAAADVRAHQVSYAVGDFAYVRELNQPIGECKKTFRPYRGPFRVVRIISPQIVQLELPTGDTHQSVVHHDRLKKCAPPPPPPPQSAALGMSEPTVGEPSLDCTAHTSTSEQRRPREMVSGHSPVVNSEPTSGTQSDSTARVPSRSRAPAISRRTQSIESRSPPASHPLQRSLSARSLVRDHSPIAHSNDCSIDDEIASRRPRRVVARPQRLIDDYRRQ